MKKRIGIVGTGYIARHLLGTLMRGGEYDVSRILTRRSIFACPDFPRRDLLTNSLSELVDHADLIVECSGDPLQAAMVVDRAFDHGLPVVTMNTEFQITAGSYFVDRGVMSEAEGDQPGSLAALREEAVGMGFRPLAFVNMKGFLDLDPTPSDMRYWARRNGISLPMVTAFTDGTKLQMEQALVANGLNAEIAQPGLLGPKTDDLNEACALFAVHARRLGKPISDYVCAPGMPHGVFLVAEHDDDERDALRYLKLGDGPLYVLQKPHILIHLEIVKTIRRTFNGDVALLTNGRRPTISVAAIAKRGLMPGQCIARAIGSFEVRGEATRIDDAPDHVPIGLLQDAVVTRRVGAGEMLTFNDIELPDSLALHAWLESQRTAKVPERALVTTAQFAAHAV